MTSILDTAAAGNVGASELQLRVFTSPTRAIGGDPRRTFSPITSTLILGDSDAVLVDAQFIRQDVADLGDMIERTGRRLTTILITHGHGDHYFGAGILRKRFPGVRIVATPGVVSHIAANRDRDVKTWSAMFGEDIAEPTAMPEPLGGGSIDLDGHAMHVIDVPQGDIAPTAVLHVQPLNAVIAGDVVYNGIHQMLGFSGPAEWERWIGSIDILERLRPRTIVAGHKKPEASDDEASRILDDTRSYIRDFANGVQSAGSVEELVGIMRAKYPDHGNLTTLLFSADAAMKSRSG